MSIFETLKKYGKSKNNAIAEAITDFNEFKTSGYIQSKRPSSGNIEVAIQALKEKQERQKGCVWCNENNKVYHDGQHFHFFCSYCGKRLEVNHEVD